MSDEIHIVEGDIPALCSTITGIADSLSALNPGDPLAIAAQGIPGSDAASCCQTHAELFNRRWKDTLHNLQAFVGELEAFLRDLEQEDQTVGKRLSDLAEQFLRGGDQDRIHPVMPPGSAPLPPEGEGGSSGSSDQFLRGGDRDRIFPVMPPGGGPHILKGADSLN